MTSLRAPTFAALSALARLILPHQCVICRRFANSTGLCGDCWGGLQHISAPSCSQCGRPLPHALPEMKCAPCWAKPPPLLKIRAACLYGEASRALILKFKHGDGLQLVPVFGHLLRRPFADICAASPSPLVVPIPLHRWRYLHRRYNQSAELARYLCHHHNREITRVEFAPQLLERTRATPSQGQYKGADRRRNINGAFRVPDRFKAQLAGRNILLIDDVMTTGATLFEAARTLTKAGSGPVSAVVIARVSSL